MYKTKAVKTVLVVSAVVSLFIAQNLYFNYNSCWNNIMFNFFARTENSTYNIKTFIGYFLTIAYIVTPWGLYFLFKTKFQMSKLFKLLVLILGVAFFIFLLVSLKNNIGIHWFLLFVPYIFLLFSFLDEKYQNKLFIYNAIFTAVHVVILVAVLLIPKSLFKDHKRYSDIVMYTQPELLCNELNLLSDDRIFTASYSSGAVLSYYCKKELTVLFNTSKYGRLDDKLFDVRTIADKDITLFNKSPISEEQLAGVCKSYKVEQINLEGAKFYKATCKKFDYDEYKTLYIDVQNEKFYNIPNWLPIGECYFKERYYK
jgi:hypothetical protein